MKLPGFRVYGYIASAVMLISSATAADAASWVTDYGTALSEARRDGRPLLVVLQKPYDPDTSFVGIGDSIDTSDNSDLLKPYQLCRIDVSTAMGRRVAKVFGAESFPYTVITDKNARRIVYRRSGHFSDAKDVIETLAAHRDSSRKAKASNADVAGDRIVLAKPVMSTEGTPVSNAVISSGETLTSTPISSSPISSTPITLSQPISNPLPSSNYSQPALPSSYQPSFQYGSGFSSPAGSSCYS